MYCDLRSLSLPGSGGGGVGGGQKKESKKKRSKKKDPKIQKIKSEVCQSLPIVHTGLTV